VADVNWQVTATTIYCDAIDEDVTIMVYKDHSTRCTGYRKYVENASKEAQGDLQKRAKKSGRALKCEGPEDDRVTEYRDKLFAEDRSKK